MSDEWTGPWALDDLLQSRVSGYWGDGEASDRRAIPVNVVRNGDISRDGLLTGAAPRFFSEREREKSLIQPGDVLLTSSGEVGKVCLPLSNHGTNLVASNFVRLLRPTQDQLSGEFLRLVLEGPATREMLPQHTGGSTIPNLLASFFSEEFIRLPPLAIQRRITDLMAHLDGHLANLRAEASAMDVALAGLRANAVAGLVDQWGAETLGRVLAERPTYGVVKPGIDPSDGVLMVRSGDVRDGLVETGGLRRITREVHEEYARSQIRPGDVLVALVGTPGAVSIAPSEVWGANIARQVGLLRCGSEIVPGFLEMVLTSPAGKAQLLSKVKGAVQQVINLGDLAEVTVPLPDLKTQERLAAWHFDAKSLSLSLAREIESLRNLRRHTLAAALSGLAELPSSYDPLLSEAS